MEKKLEDIEEEYDLELGRIVKEIKKEKARKVLLQFPDGLKPYAVSIVNRLKEKVNAEFFIWFSSCFGACDTPKLDGFDLLVQFGHSPWKN